MHVMYKQVIYDSFVTVSISNPVTCVPANHVMLRRVRALSFVCGVEFCLEKHIPLADLFSVWY